MKAIIFTVFVIVSLLLYCFFWYTDPRNFDRAENYPIDTTGKYYNPL